MTAIAIVGSRDYPHLPDVERLVQKIAADDPSNVIVSGGAKGVDKAAESTAFACGLAAYSYRVLELGIETFGIQEWKLGADSYVRYMAEEPNFLNYDSALAFRNSIIVQRCNRLVAFWTGHSRGTALALDFAHAYKRPERVYGVADEERVQL